MTILCHAHHCGPCAVNFVISGKVVIIIINVVLIIDLRQLHKSILMAVVCKDSLEQSFPM